MKWLQIIISIAEIVLPFLAKIKKDRAEKELEVLSTGIEAFSKAEHSSGKGKVLKGIVCDLAVNNGVAKRLHKRIKDYETRIWKKLF